MAELLEKNFAPFVPKPKRIGGLANLSEEELTALQQSLRKLQKPLGETFWDFSKFLSRLDDEKNRRTAQS